MDRSIPVMILTSTDAEKNILQDFNIPASRLWKKPLEMERFNWAVSELENLSRRPIQATRPQEEAERSAASTGEKKRWWWPFG